MDYQNKVGDGKELECPCWCTCTEVSKVKMLGLKKSGDATERAWEKSSTAFVGPDRRRVLCGSMRDI